MVKEVGIEVATCIDVEAAMGIGVEAAMDIDMEAAMGDGSDSSGSVSGGSSGCDDTDTRFKTVAVTGPIHFMVLLNAVVLTSVKSTSSALRFDVAPDSVTRVASGLHQGCPPWLNRGRRFLSCHGCHRRFSHGVSSHSSGAMGMQLETAAGMQHGAVWKYKIMYH